MFDIGWSEIFLVVVIAVVVVGPKELPRMMRLVGQWTGRARAMADQFRRSFDDLARQTELEEMRAEVLKAHDSASLAEIQRETEIMLGNIPSDPMSSPAPAKAPPKAPTKARIEKIEQGQGTKPAPPPGEPKAHRVETPAESPEGPRKSPEPPSPARHDEP